MPEPLFLDPKKVLLLERRVRQRLLRSMREKNGDPTLFPTYQSMFKKEFYVEASYFFQNANEVEGSVGDQTIGKFFNWCRNAESKFDSSMEFESRKPLTTSALERISQFGGMSLNELKKPHNEIMEVPPNLLPPDVCKRLEFEEESVNVRVITSTLHWAYRNFDRIINSAFQNGSQYSYLLASKDSNVQLRADRVQQMIHEKGNVSHEQVRVLDVTNEFIVIADASKVTSRSNLVFPLPNDIVLYEFQSNEVAKMIDPNYITTALNGNHLIAVMGTSVYDPDASLAHDYLDVLIRRDITTTISMWVNSLLSKQEKLEIGSNKN